jgi:hypothetical protein
MLGHIVVQCRCHGSLKKHFKFIHLLVQQSTLFFSPYIILIVGCAWLMGCRVPHKLCAQHCALMGGSYRNF